MASITVRNLDEDVKRSLSIQAARNGRSMEAEVREILRVAVTISNRQQNNWARELNARFAAIGGLDRNDD